MCLFLLIAGLNTWGLKLFEPETFSFFVSLSSWQLILFGLYIPITYAIVYAVRKYAQHSRLDDIQKNYQTKK